MSDTVKVSKLANCDICVHVDHVTPPKVAVYDGATKMGAWAYMCEEHFEYVGIGLGTGKGQRLILEEI